MLWVDRVGDRRSQAILAQYFSQKNGDRHKRSKRARTKNWDSRQENRETKQCQKRKRNNAKYESCTLINLEGVGHDCNPSVAALRLYPHGRNDHSHRAGIDHPHRRNTSRPIDSGWHPPRETDPRHFLLCRYLIPEDLISPLGRDDTSSM